MTTMNEKVFESLFFKIQLPNENLICCNIYRSPSNDNTLNKDFLDNLRKCFHYNNISSKKCLITGDFNYDLSNKENIHVFNFVELMLENHYFSVINKPTRITDTECNSN